MKSRTALVGTAVIAVGMIVVSPRLALSPGPLTRGHHEIANDCFACHSSLRGLPAAKCIACHPLDRIGVAPRDGQAPTGADTALAGMHEAFAGTSCLECHGDHAGPDPASATPAFSHDSLSGSFRGRCTTCHERNRPADDLHRDAGDQCRDCHTTTEWKPATFEHRKFAASRSCAECHGKVRPADEVHRTAGDGCGDCHTTTEWKPATVDHQKLARQACTACHVRNRPTDDLHRQVNDDCRACHTTTAWKPATFEHDQYFVLDRDHRTTCRTCHTDPGSYKGYTCYGCHEHTQSGILREHREERISDLNNCVRCHRSADEHEGRGEGGREGHREHEDDD